MIIVGRVKRKWALQKAGAEDRTDQLKDLQPLNGKRVLDQVLFS